MYWRSIRLVRERNANFSLPSIDRSTVYRDTARTMFKYNTRDLVKCAWDETFITCFVTMSDMAEIWLTGIVDNYRYREKFRFFFFFLFTVRAQKNLPVVAFSIRPKSDSFFVICSVLCAFNVSPTLSRRDLRIRTMTSSSLWGDPSPPLRHERKPGFARCDLTFCFFFCCFFITNTCRRRVKLLATRRSLQTI